MVEELEVDPSVSCPRCKAPMKLIKQARSREAMYECETDSCPVLWVTIEEQ